MSVQFPDLNVTPTSNSKNTLVKVVKLNPANWATAAGVTANLATLPAQSTIISIEYWKQTQLSGGGITAATLSIGVTGALTQFVNAFDVLTPAAGTLATITPVTNIMQPYGLPQGPDITLQYTGVATTGAPTAGAIYVTIYYVM